MNIGSSGVLEKPRMPKNKEQKKQSKTNKFNKRRRKKKTPSNVVAMLQAEKIYKFYSYNNSLLFILILVTSNFVVVVYIVWVNL
jgi:hypothetical protein